MRGRRLVAPAGAATRPTTDRARQALFNVLEHAPWAVSLNGARVIDLFAGSGALGLEAMSRGAAFCLFVDTDESARGAIRSNLDALDRLGSARIHRRDATDLGPRPASAGPPFDLAFLDPPYRQGLGERAISGLVQDGWLAPEALVVLERAADEPDIAPSNLQPLAARRWGPARVDIWRLASG